MLSDIVYDRRITRPIGLRAKPKPHPFDPLKSASYAIAQVFKLASTKVLVEGFDCLRSHYFRKKNQDTSQKLALKRLSVTLEDIKKRYAMQCLFRIRNFTPTTETFDFEQLNWHRDNNERQFIDKTNSILKLVSYAPFKKPPVTPRRKKALSFQNQNVTAMTLSISKLFIKKMGNIFHKIKTRSIVQNTETIRGIEAIQSVVNRVLSLGFFSIKLCQNRLTSKFLKPRQEPNRFVSMAELRSQMFVESERRAVFKIAIDKQKVVYNKVTQKVIETQKQMDQMERNYLEQAQEIQYQINKKQLYISSILQRQDQILEEQTEDFQRLKTIFNDLRQSNSSKIIKRNLLKKYHIVQKEPIQDLVTKNQNLWNQVNAHQYALGVFSVKQNPKEQMECKAAKDKFTRENARMKGIIAFYVRQNYGLNLKKETRLLENLKSELKEAQQKLDENKLEQVRVMFT